MSSPTNPTQVRFPWRAALRTFLQFFVALVLILPTALAIFTEVMDRYIPPDVMALIAYIVGGIVAMATVATRLMAIPQVNEWLTTALNIGAAPKPEPEYVPERAYPDVQTVMREDRPKVVPNPFSDPHEGPKS